MMVKITYVWCGSCGRKGAYSVPGRGVTRCRFCRALNPPLLGHPEEKEFHKALERGELELVYQPEVVLPEGDLVGVEALLRWNRPERGVLPPAVFLRRAEETGLIVPIGTWVLHEACRQAARWRHEQSEEPALAVSINLSGRQFDSGLLETVASCLSATGLPSSLLRLEVTESIFLGDVGSAARQLESLRELGVKVTLDSFGGPDSSLNALREFPVDFVKLDRSLLGDIEGNPRYLTILAGAVNLLNSLDLTVVAKGVEREAQLGQLHRLGCAMAQGNHFGPPLPPGLLAERLRFDG